jgi:GPH family glycoside/pentoside/hexuronide:cation symporter
MTLTPHSAPQSQSWRLPFWFKAAYSIGDLTTSGPIAIVMFYQLYFLTDVVGLRPDLAGWAVAIGRSWDAVNDPLFGVLSDRVRSRWGRRRVLLLLGALPLGVAFTLMWLIPPLGPRGLVLYYALTFMLFDSAYTAVHVGYNALTPELTVDYDERSELNGFRMTFAIAGSLGSIILVTVLSWSMGVTQQLFRIVGVTLGLFFAIPPLVVFRVTRGYRVEMGESSLPVWEAFRTTVSNRPFRIVMAIYLLSWTTASILSAILVYLASYHFRIPEQSNYFVLAAQGSAIVFIPLSVKIARGLDKRWSFILGAATWSAALLGISALRPDQVTLAYVLAVLSGFGVATAYVIPWSMLPDVIEHDQLRTGQRREGAYYALAAFFQKLGTGLALWLMAQLLALTGYVTPELGGDVLPQQPPAAISALRIFAGPVCAALLLAAILFAGAYPISREQHLEHLEALERA